MLLSRFKVARFLFLIVCINFVNIKSNNKYDINQLMNSAIILSDISAVNSLLNYKFTDVEIGKFANLAMYVAELRNQKLITRNFERHVENASDSTFNEGVLFGLLSLPLIISGYKSWISDRYDRNYLWNFSGAAGLLYVAISLIAKSDSMEKENTLWLDNMANKALEIHKILEAHSNKSIKPVTLDSPLNEKSDVKNMTAEQLKQEIVKFLGSDEILILIGKQTLSLMLLLGVVHREYTKLLNKKVKVTFEEMAMPAVNAAVETIGNAIVDAVSVEFKLSKNISKALTKDFIDVLAVNFKEMLKADFSKIHE